MYGLPAPALLIHQNSVAYAFHTLYFQAQDQAKAAVKGHYDLAGGTVIWLLMIGPYWTPVEFGPFEPEELSVRANKKKKRPSADWKAQTDMEELRDGPPRVLSELYLLSEKDSFDRLKHLFQQTDGLAWPLVDALNTEVCDFRAQDFYDELSLIYVT
jgi:hypothetical protein